MKRATLLAACLMMLLAASCGVGPAGGTPGLVYDGNAGGCGNIFAYKGNKTGTEFLVVSADREKLGLSTTARTFHIDSAPDGLQVKIDRFNKENSTHLYCNDVIDDRWERPVTWIAKKGNVTITLATDTAAFNTPYQATIVVEDATFRNADGEEVVLKRAEIRDVMVGWLPG